MRALKLAAAHGTVVDASSHRAPTDRDPGAPTPVEPLAPGPRPDRPRTDPEGMKRMSLYLDEAAAAAFTGAVDEVLAALKGHQVPKHVVISALARYAAACRDEVIADLRSEIAEQLREQLRALQGAPE